MRRTRKYIRIYQQSLKKNHLLTRTTSFKCPYEKKTFKCIINVESTANKALSTKLPEQVVVLAFWVFEVCVSCEPHTIIALHSH